MWQVMLNRLDAITTGQWIQIIVGAVMSAVIGIAATVWVGKWCIKKGDESLRKTAGEMTQLFESTSRDILERVMEQSVSKLVLDTSNVRSWVGLHKSFNWAVTIINQGLAPAFISSVEMGEMVWDTPYQDMLDRSSSRMNLTLEAMREYPGDMLAPGEKRFYGLTIHSSILPIPADSKGSFGREADTIEKFLSAPDGKLYLRAYYDGDIVLEVLESEYPNLRCFLNELINSLRHLEKMSHQSLGGQTVP